MNSTKSILLSLLCLFSAFCAHANEPYVELIATDNDGMKFTIELYVSDSDGRKIDLVLYKNSDPSTRYYGTGTDLNRGFYYVNTDSPLFDFTLPKGDYKTYQPFKNILYVHYGQNNFFVTPKDTRDPELKIPYIVHKKEGQIVTPVDNASGSNQVALQLSDFITSDMQPKDRNVIFRTLQQKGFSGSKDESNEITTLKNGSVSIDHYIEEMEGNADCFNISFPSADEAQKFISDIADDRRWTRQTNYFGKTVGWKYNRVTISAILEDFPDVSITLLR